MYIKSIELKDFRNYESLSLQFNKSVNLILGKNGLGKTNILEAIYITSIGKSFRTNHENEMIRFGQNLSKVSIINDKEGYEGSVEIKISKDSKKEIVLDGVKIKKASELLKNLFIVIFYPDDLKIVKEDPEKRRKFIDRELCQIKPSYFNNLNNYKKVLIQRNTYLKEKNINHSILEVWDLELAKYGAEIIVQRSDFIKRLNSISAEIHSKITNGKENLRLSYVPNIKYKENIEEIRNDFLEKLLDNRESDIRFGSTSCGPHKDDLEFFINSNEKPEINVRNFGSQGQQRTTALALKLAEIEIIKKETGEDAILLLDDVMSELDETRQEFLVKSLAKNQLFVTTNEIPKALINEFPTGTIFRVSEDGVSVENY